MRVLDIDGKFFRLLPTGVVAAMWSDDAIFPNIEFALDTGQPIREAMPGARQMVTRLIRAGWSVMADDGETDPEDWPVITPDTVVWECAQVDEMTLRCVRGTDRGWIFVILGNGVDWLCDYTVNLEEWVDG